MPFKKRYKAKRAVKSKDVEQDKKIAKIAKQLQPEWKWAVYNSGPVNFPIASAPGIAITSIGNGNLQGERVGLQVRLMQIKFNLTILTVSAAQQTARFIVVRSKDSIIPNQSSVMQDVGAGGLNPNNVIDPLLSPLFEVLYDGKFAFGDLDSGKGCTRVSKTVKIDKLAHWAGALGTDIVKGQLFFLALATGAAGQVTFYFDSVVRYTDA